MDYIGLCAEDARSVQYASERVHVRALGDCLNETTEQTPSDSFHAWNDTEKECNHLHVHRHCRRHQVCCIQISKPRRLEAYVFETVFRRSADDDDGCREAACPFENSKSRGIIILAFNFKNDKLERRLTGRDCHLHARENSRMWGMLGLY